MQPCGLMPPCPSQAAVKHPYMLCHLVQKNSVINRNNEPVLHTRVKGSTDDLYNQQFHGSHFKFVSPIQYPTTCEIWLQFHILPLGYCAE